MRILLLAPQPFFEVRGTPINVRLMATALGELGHQVDLLVYPHGEDVEMAGVTIRRVIKIPGLPKAPIGPSLVKIVYDVFMFIQAAWALLTRRYGAIHGVEEAGIMAWILSRVFGVPYVFDMDSHMTDQLRYSGFLGNRPVLAMAEGLEARAIAGAAAVITVCPYLTDVAKKYADPSRVHQVEDVPQSFPPPPEGLTAESLRAELDIAHGAPVALYTGNLEKYQGVELAIEAMAEVARALPEARLVVVGGSAAQVERYRAMAQAQGVGNAVIFTGARPLAHMPVFHQMADVLLSPRLGGTNTPLKIYTYLATGKPVVATDLPTHTQLLTPDIAMLAKPERMAYSAAILLLLKDTERRTELGRRGREFVEAGFNHETFRRKVEDAYRAI